jgi:hypothetical protein
VVAADLLYENHLQEFNHPADVVASGSMYAFGDPLLGIFIACLFMIPTAFLLWVAAGFEIITRYGLEARRFWGEIPGCAVGFGPTAGFFFLRGSACRGMD